MARFRQEGHPPGSHIDSGVAESRAVLPLGYPNVAIRGGREIVATLLHVREKAFSEYVS